MAWSITKEYAKSRYSLSGNKRENMAEVYEKVAKNHECKFIDASKIVQTGEDGVHLDFENHQKLAIVIKKMVISELQI